MTLLRTYDKVTGAIKQTTTKFGVYSCVVCGDEYEMPFRLDKKKKTCGVKCAHHGSRVSAETRNKLSVANSGKKRTDETCKKMSICKKGRKFSDSARKLMSLHQHRKGRGLPIETIIKGHETRKRNGTYAKSSGEDALYKFLCEKIGQFDIERQVNVNGWRIDFHIKSVDLYVQYDGIYYHGLDVTFDVLVSRATLRGKSIGVLTTFLRDCEQRDWFIQNKLKLLRVVEGTSFTTYDFS
jgi:DNA-directed RNA polymerase subunit RPC12/RpoP